jgi:hypothetical protein
VGSVPSGQVFALQQRLTSAMNLAGQFEQQLVQARR